MFSQTSIISAQSLAMQEYFPPIITTTVLTSANIALPLFNRLTLELERQEIGYLWIIISLFSYCLSSFCPSGLKLFKQSQFNIPQVTILVPFQSMPQWQFQNKISLNSYNACNMHLYPALLPIYQDVLASGKFIFSNHLG